jgi:GT2 family glycosyltransferase
MLLSIIIVNFNSGDLIADCIRSAESALMDPAVVEWLVVDNSKNQQDRTLIQQQFPTVQWLDMGYNAGFARANNAGMRASKGKLLLLLNPDTLLKPGAVVTACNRLSASSYVAAGMQLVHANGQPQFSGSYFMKGGLNHLLPLPYWGALLKGIVSLFAKEKPSFIEVPANQEVDWISGAFLMVKREAFEQTKGMDESFFLYAEEVEWCSRLRKLGKLVVFGDLQTIHLIGQSIQEASGAADNSYTNLSDKKGFQLMVSNHLRIRKQYGIFWLFFQLINYSWAVLFSMIVGLMEYFVSGKSLKNGYSKWHGFSSNVVRLWGLLPKLVKPEKHFFKYL